MCICLKNRERGTEEGGGEGGSEREGEREREGGRKMLKFNLIIFYYAICVLPYTVYK